MNTNCTPMLLCDFYKISHRPDYPKGTEFVYSTFTARKSYIPGINGTVVFGLQRFVQKYLIDYFNDHFFSRPVDEVVEEYARTIRQTLGDPDPATEHIAALHALGYLPLHIASIPEGNIVPLRVPYITIENTLPEFFWVTNYIETLLSAELWLPTTSATLANEYRKVFDHYALITNPEAKDFAAFQGHDFSFRGMSSVESAQMSGMGHLLSFVGTDTIPAILEAQNYYFAEPDKELIGTSIPATEHSVMCAGGKDGELETYRRLLTETHPTGFISIVSDTWDLWHVITQTLGVDLHDVIMARDGKLVVRPDSGDPVKIMCGDPEAEPGSPAFKGVVELLWEFFGGTISSTGYKVLDSHIGAIYGDSITLLRAEAICEGLKQKGFASTDWVAGIGSYTYQYVTRDTFGHAMKATWVQINGVEHKIFKDPVTDDGVKKSLTGRIVVMADDFRVIDNLTLAEERAMVEDQMLQTVFEDGHFIYQWNFHTIRAAIAAQRKIAVNATFPQGG